VCVPRFSLPKVTLGPHRRARCESSRQENEVPTSSEASLKRATWERLVFIGF
jgi:hypothetical protein